MWWSGIEALAAVHRTDWRALGLDWLGNPGRGKPGHRAADVVLPGVPRLGHPGREVPVIESTWQWLVEHQPAEEGEVVLSWGDSRIGNIIWDDFRCAAVVDWEMASLGPARAGPGLVALLRPPVRRGPGRPPPGRASAPTRRRSSATPSSWAGP